MRTMIKKHGKLSCLLMALLMVITMSVPAALSRNFNAAAKPKVKITTTMSASNKMYMDTNKAINVKTNTASTLTYKSSNSKIAAVKSGKLYAYKPGTAKIQIYANPKSSKYQQGYKYFTVNVLPKKPGTPEMERIGKNISVYVPATKGAQYYQFQYAANSKMTGAKAVSKTAGKYGMSYLISAPDKKTYYVRVRSYAVVSGKKYYSGWSKVQKTAVEPSKPVNIPVENIYVNENRMNAQLEDGAFVIKATVYPSNATNKTITWSSSDTSIATVDSKGKVTPLKEGKVRITAKAGNEKDYCDVNVMSLESMVNEVLRLVNQERAKVGMHPQKLHPNLQKASMIRADELNIKNSHTRPDGSDSSTALYESGVANNSGENIAFGHESPSEVVSAWMNSPGHRAPLLYSKGQYLGIGVSKCRSIGFCWTLEFIDGDPDEKVTISFDTLGGSSVSSIVIPTGGTLYMNNIPVPIKSCYKFNGWYNDTAYTWPAPTNSMVVQRDRILYAKWIPE